MKKLSALILGLGLLAGSTVNTFAGNFNASGSALNPGEGNTDEMTKNVNGQISADPVYSVDIEWGNMTFSYEGTWHPDTHTYTDAAWKSTNPGSEIDSGMIRVLNHSNRNVKAQCNFTNEYKLNAQWNDEPSAQYPSTVISTDTAEGVEYSNKFDTAAGSIKGFATLKMVNEPPSSEYLLSLVNGKKSGQIGEVSISLTDSTPTV